MKLEVARVVERTRTRLGLSQTQFGADAGTSRNNVDRWESPDDPCAPNMMQLAIMPSDAGLPLFAWCLAHHNHQAHAAPAIVHADDVTRVAEVLSAISNVGRAVTPVLKGGHVDNLSWQRIYEAARRMVDVAQELEQRATVELECRRAR